MKPIVSLPLFSFLRYVLDPLADNHQLEGEKKYKFFGGRENKYAFMDKIISMCYSNKHEFLGYREITWDQSCASVATYIDGYKKYIDEFIDLTNPEIRTTIVLNETQKKYSHWIQLIDEYTVQYTSNGHSDSYFRQEFYKNFYPVEGELLNWKSFSKRNHWVSSELSGDSKDYIVKEIWNDQNYSFVEYTNSRGDAFYECLRRLPSNYLDTHGSLNRYQDHCKIIDADFETIKNKQKSISKAGLILDISTGAEKHREVGKKLKQL
jgi:hypothetical protein